MRKRTAKQLGTRHDLNYFKTSTLRGRWLTGLAICLPVIFLAWLGVRGLRGESTPYSSGRLSRAHAFLGKQCSTCHANFVEGVRVGGFRKHADDQACLTCHQAPVHHANQSFTPDCASCHTEHVGSPQLARTADQSCVQCHRDLHTNVGAARFERTVFDFARKHPEFAALKKTDPGTVAFNHAVHMRPNLPGPPGKQNVQLECADCHRLPADDGGHWRFGSEKWQSDKSSEQVTPKQMRKGAGNGFMNAITYDQQCAACHTLPFDRRIIESAPHDKPSAVDDFVKKSLVDFLQKNPAAWRETEDSARQIPGTRAMTQQATSAAEWLRITVAEDESLLWRKTCKQCHTLESRPASLPHVLPAAMPTRWLPHSVFDHSAHAAVRCESCHSLAAGSTKTSDVLVPGIETCRKCHSGSSTASAESGCFLCHQYHDWQQRKPFKAIYTIPQITGLD